MFARIPIAKELALDAMLILAAVVSAALFVYLVVALVKPEWFS